MKKILLSLGAVVVLSVSFMSSEASAKPRSIQIVITDQGFVPSSTLAVMNRKINIHIVNTGTRIHQLSIPFFTIFTENLKPGSTSDVSFAPWVAGKFDIISDPSGTDTPEFRGQFVVTDSK